VGISVEVNAGDFTRAIDKLDSNYLPDAISKTLKSSSELIASTAKTSHRFQSHTHIGEKAILAEYKRGTLSARAYLEKNIAPYIKRLHRGWGTWAPDEFLYKAKKITEGTILSDIKNAIKKAIEKAGL